MLHYTYTKKFFLTGEPKRANAGCGRLKYPVKCIETSKEYKSIDEAAKDIGARNGNLSRAIRNSTKIKGLTFIKIE